MTLHVSYTTSAQHGLKRTPSHRPQIRALDSDRTLKETTFGLRQLEPLTAKQLKDVEFACTGPEKRWYLAHQWWRLFWHSQERLDGETMLAKIYRRGHPRYATYKRFSGAEILLSWLCTSGINPDRVQLSELEFFITRIYPSHPDFFESNTVADLVEFSCVCEFLKGTGAVYGHHFEGLFGEVTVTKVLERRAAIRAVSTAKNHQGSTDTATQTKDRSQSTAIPED
ncbi:MAG: hypothetical protein CMH52_06770 [Myxococcales bacterium]|nr:hypothetical protein [Myxococcales bacterium]